jgi:hypothetical protein
MTTLAAKFKISQENFSEVILEVAIHLLMRFYHYSLLLINTSRGGSAEVTMAQKQTA